VRIAEWKGDWALVTGASSGIGREFCLQLAAAGMNVAMVARRRQRLDEMAADLHARHGVRTIAIDQDLSLPGAAAAVRNRIADENVTIRLLINNAAFGPWGRFEDTSAEVYERLVHLVSATPVSMCRLFLPDLASFKSSAIVNLSSPAALQPIPYKAVYSAAKSCLHNFSLALYAEWRARGVHVQTLIPGPTASELDSIGGAYKSAIAERRWPAHLVVRASLANLRDAPPLVTTAKGIYKQRVFAGLFPTKVVVRKVARMFQPPSGGRPRG
jgi:short-subunit dehydrogenase